MNLSRYWLSMAGILLATFCLAQSGNPERRQRILNSFENVSIDSASNRIYFEQRLYRNPMIGLLELKQQLPASDSTEFVPLYQGIPVARYKFGADFRTTTISHRERSTYYTANPFRWRSYKFDFRLHPEYFADYGYRERPFQSKVNLLLQSQLYLRRGLVLNWGVTFPLINKLDNQPMNIRPAPIYLNQFLALDSRNFLSVSAGMFYSFRYGANVQYRYADLNKPWSFGLETGLTGYYYFPRKGLYIEPMNELIMLADVSYRILSRDVTLKLTGGQFLYNDRGVRLDLIRQFNSVDIGFYVSATGNGTNAGFNFVVPLPPGRIAQSQRFRLRSTEEYRWEYSYNQGNNVAARYSVGKQLDGILRQYHQAYLYNQYKQYQK